jgi:SAM-dependent methyltransferase
MHEPVIEFIKICSKNFPIDEPIYEFGSLQPQGQEGYADLRPYFPNKKYVGTDLYDGIGVDTILDIHNIDLLKESVGTIIVVNTLEHVEWPCTAVEQIQRVLKPSGTVIISVPFNANIHDFPNDYWRFTPECLKNLLKGFPQVFVSCAGKDKKPHTVIGIGYGESTVLPEAFYREIEDWQVRWQHTSHVRKPFIKKFSRKWGKSIRKRLHIFRF